MSRSFARTVLILLCLAAAAFVYWRKRAPETLASETREDAAIGFLPAADAPASNDALSTRAAGECSTVLRARLVDGDGRPIAGASLACAYPKASAQSSADGTVELHLNLLEGDELREVHLEAAAPGYANASWKSGARQDALTELGEVVLERGATLRGRVLDEDGSAVAGAEVCCTRDLERYESWRLHGPSEGLARATTDARGSFVLEGAPLAPVRVWAGTPESFWSCTEELDASGEVGALTLELRAIPPQNVIDASVLAPDGSPVAGAELAFEAREGASSLSLRAEADERGRYRHVVTLRGPHEVRAGDPSGRFGSARAERVLPGAQIELVLSSEPARTVRGRVDGGARASVSLHRALAPDPSLRMFPARYERVARAQVACDDEGRFALPFEAAGTYWLRAEAQGFATADLGPLELSDQPAQEFELALARGGTIEGRVLVDRGASPDGRMVVASRGDGRAVTAVADEEGRFRIEHATAGPWWIGTSDVLLPGGAWHRAAKDAGGVPPSNCEVREGETSSFDVSYRSVSNVRLRGRFTIPGGSTEGWQAALATAGERRREVDARELGPGGEFELHGAQAGDYVVQVYLPSKGPEALWIVSAVRLADGDNEWFLDLPLSRAQGRLVSQPPGSSLVWRWQRDSALYASGVLLADAQGSFVVPRVPAGKIAFLRDGGGGQDLLKEIELPETATIDLEL